MPARRGLRGHRAWGVLAGLTLAAAACFSAAMGVRPGLPLLDGLAPPPPYRWVNPPTELRRDNKAPSSLSTNVDLAASGTPAALLATSDGQVELDLAAGAFAARAGQTSVQVSVQPLDPASVLPPPAGLALQGNAYRIDATYQPAGTPATPTASVDVALRYPVDATQALLLSGGAWQLLATTPESSAETVVGHATGLGVFAAGLAGGAPAKPKRTPAWAYAAAGLALLAAGIPLLRRRSGGT